MSVELATPRRRMLTLPFPRPGIAIAEAMLLSLVIVVSVVLRFWDLANTPPGLHQDEAIYAFNGLAVRDGIRDIYFGEREPLFIYVLAATTFAFGHDVVVLRATSAAIGLATILATWAAGRVLFGRWVGVLAAAALAGSLWHVILSRNVFRADTLPLFTAVAVTVAVLAWRRQSLRWWLAAGCVAGLLPYTYLASRFFPAVAVAFLGLQLVVDRAALRRRARGLFLLTLMMAVVATPLAVYVARDPEAAFGRPGQVSLLAGPTRTLVANAIRVAGMFTHAGDASWRHNYAGEPVFAWPVATMFAVGLFLLICRPRHRPAQLTLLWLLLMLTPSALSVDSPHYLRTSGALPAAYIVLGYGLARTGQFCWHLARPIVGIWSIPATGAIVAAPLALLAVSTISTSQLLFADWRFRPEVAAAYNADLYHSGRAIAADVRGSVRPRIMVPVDRYTDRASLLYGLWPWTTYRMTEPGMPVDAPVTSYDDRRATLVPAGATTLWYLVHHPERVLAIVGDGTTVRPITPAGGGAAAMLVLGPVAPPAREPDVPVPARRGGGLALLGRDQLRAVASGGVALVALHWQLDSTSATTAIFLHARDEQNQTIATADIRLGDAGIGVEPGRLVTWHDLSIPPGIGGGDYRLVAGVYDLATSRPVPLTGPNGVSVETELGHLTVLARPADPGDFRPRQSVDATLGARWRVIGVDVDASGAGPGTRRLVSAYVAALTDGVSADSLRLVLRQDGLADEIAPRPTRLPPLSPGQAARLDFDLLVPAAVAPGSMTLVLTDGADSVLLDTLPVDVPTRSFAEPVVATRLGTLFGDAIELIGFSRTDRIRAGYPLDLRLYWRATRDGTTSFTVFVHVVDEQGRIVAQQDTLPDQGRRPTSGWLRGEIVTDRVSPVLPASLPPGRYNVLVGLYDPITGARLTSPAGTDVVKLDTLTVVDN